MTRNKIDMETLYFKKADENEELKVRLAQSAIVEREKIAMIA